MADTVVTAAAPALPTGWRANPIAVRVLSLHWWLGVVVAPIVYFQYKKHAGDAWGPILQYVLVAVGGTAFVSADLFNTPTTRAKVAHVDTLGMARSLTAGEIVAGQS